MIVVGNVLWLALLHLMMALVFFVTIIRIPFGVVSLRMAGLALWPFGKLIVRQDRIPSGVRVVIGPLHPLGVPPPSR
jgi:uncharacterized membrane protein YccF (DUF307 family)